MILYVAQPHKGARLFSLISENATTQQCCRLLVVNTHGASSTAYERHRSRTKRANVKAHIIRPNGHSDSCARIAPTHRCDPATFAEVLSACAPPTLECLVVTVLPSLLAGISSRDKNGSSSGNANPGGKGSERGGEWAAAGSGRNAAAIRATCRFAASVAIAGREDPMRFRERVSGSGLRKLGPLGKEAEVALAEAFLYGGASGAM